jgi:hypothetical protein
VCARCVSGRQSTKHPQLASARALVERHYRSELLRPLPCLAVGDLVIPGPNATGHPHGTVGVVIDMEQYKPSDAEKARVLASARSAAAGRLSGGWRSERHTGALQRRIGSRTVCSLVDPEHLDAEPWGDTNGGDWERTTTVAGSEANNLLIEWGWKIVVRWCKSVNLASFTGFCSDSELQGHIEKCLLEHTIEESDYRSLVFAVPITLKTAVGSLRSLPSSSTDISTSMDWVWSICNDGPPQRLCDAVDGSGPGLVTNTQLQCLHPWQNDVPDISVLCPAVGRRWDVIPFYCSRRICRAGITAPIPVSGLLFARVMEAALPEQPTAWGRIYVQATFQGESFTTASRACCPSPVWHHSQLGCEHSRLADDGSRIRSIPAEAMSPEPVRSKACGCQHCWQVNDMFAAASIQVTVWRHFFGRAETLGRASIKLRDICNIKSATPAPAKEREFWQSAAVHHEFIQRMNSLPTRWLSPARDGSRAAPDWTIATATTVAAQNVDALTATGEVLKELRSLPLCMAAASSPSRTASPFNPLTSSGASYGHPDFCSSAEIPGLLDVWIPFATNGHSSGRVRMQFRMWRDKDFVTAVDWRGRMQTVFSIACANGEHALVAEALRRLSAVRLPDKQHLVRMDGIRGSDGLSALDAAALGSTGDHYRCVQLVLRHFNNRALTTSCPWINWNAASVRDSERDAA